MPLPSGLICCTDTADHLPGQSYMQSLIPIATLTVTTPSNLPTKQLLCRLSMLYTSKPCTFVLPSLTPTLVKRFLLSPHVCFAGALFPTGPSLIAVEPAPAAPPLNLSLSPAKPLAPAPHTLPTPSAELLMMRQQLPPSLPRQPVTHAGRTPAARAIPSNLPPTGNRAVHQINRTHAAGKISNHTDNLPHPPPATQQAPGRPRLASAILLGKLPDKS